MIYAPSSKQLAVEGNLKISSVNILVLSTEFGFLGQKRDKEPKFHHSHARRFTSSQHTLAFQFENIELHLRG